MFKRTLIAFAALIITTVPAFAHAVPKAMTPAPDSTVSAPRDRKSVCRERVLNLV